MKNLNRRLFLKGSLVLAGTWAFLRESSLAIADALKDAAVKAQGYVHDVTSAKPTDAKYAVHVASVNKTLKEKGKAENSVSPMCSNCTQFKNPEGQWGICAMVQATGKNGKYVYENGWCKVWTIKKDKIG